MAKTYYELDPGMVINTEADVLDVFGKLYAQPQRRLLINQANLNPDFFDLSTGLAGEVLQKLVNYHIPTAFVVDPKSIKSERFQELMNETSVSDEYRFFPSREAAVAWLQES